jgi:cytochrome c556
MRVEDRRKSRGSRCAWACAFGIAGWVCSVATAEPDVQQVIEDRVAGFRDIGSAFKNIGDELKTGKPNVAKIQMSAGAIDNYTAAVHNWFPPGSQPPPKKSGGWFDWLCNWFSCADAYEHADPESHAKPEIWSQPERFNELLREFEAEAKAMRQVSQRGDVAQINAQFKKLGASCKSCHDVFREEME